MLVDDARCNHMEEAYSMSGLMTALWVIMSLSFCLLQPVDVSVFFFNCSGLFVYIEML